MKQSFLGTWRGERWVLRVKIFRFNSSLTSFVYPAVKIAVCIALVVLCVSRNRIFRISSGWGKWLAAIFFTAVGILSILCFLLSVCELLCVAENREKLRPNHAPAKAIPLAEILAMAKENDILEIEVVKDGVLLALGASAVSDYGSSEFSDKKYYIGQTEYESIEEFAAGLQELFPAGYVQACRIDGLPCGK